ncbi:MAG: glutathione S-transferase family protein [Rhodospirillaceae bacterium]
MMSATLVIGNRSYSSWSLRPWLALRHAAVSFCEVVIPLRQPGTKAAILAYSASGKVPVFSYDGVTVWESLAICEVVAERHPEARLWPIDAATRSLARAVAAEMHGGFPEIRKAFPMDLKRRPEVRQVPVEAWSELERLTGLWRSLRERQPAGGPFLFGHFTIADAMYAPVCTRLDTYGLPLDNVCRDYVSAVLALPAMVEWRATALNEPWVINY